MDLFRRIEPSIEPTAVASSAYAAQVVMCGCPVWMPMGWCVVWQAVLRPVAVAVAAPVRTRAGGLPEAAGSARARYLDRLAGRN